MVTEADLQAAIAAALDGRRRDGGRRPRFAQFPTNLGVNPQHTIMALARMWAEQLLDG